MEKKDTLQRKIMRFAIYITLVAVFIIFANLAEKEDELTSIMSTERYNIGAIAYNSKIFIFGGEFEHKPLNLTEEFNPRDGTIVEKSPMPIAVTSFATVAYRDRIYIIGGIDADGEYSTSVQIYDPAMDQWEIGTSLQKGRAFIFGFVYEDNIYIDGYYKNKYNRSSLEMYEEKRNEWVTVDNSITYMPKSDGTIFGDKEIIVNHYGSNGKQFLAYDLKEERWYESAKSPKNISDSQIVCVDNKAYLFEGYDVLEYNFDNDIWMIKTRSDNRRYFHDAVLVDDKIYLIGGRDAGSSNGSNLATIDEYDYKNDEWRRIENYY